ncbi:PepSY-associated TM helix domain-containing protein [Acidovorax sp. Leaf78]|uniref:PepSY-associated TM helix domain-containing protein n=1 Tax=Acidovorax sp. Leaf78 TaxID=1736237 RepID=UPI0006FA42F8|nr:PepSY-associated TM helix domain-containing protein [Acidovorax sp. Leaf78]KQO19646.1 peptidase [Acidovorax sp. Leaf78]
MLHAKRWLYLVHRWLGVLLCAFFAMWFVSGVVMMYVGYPKLTQAERLAHLPPLRPATQGPDRVLEPAEALQRAGITGPLQDLRLAVASAGRAVYLVIPATAQATHTAPASKEAPPRRPAAPAVIDAITGAVLQQVDTQHAVASASAFAQGAAGPIQHLGTVDEDAFTHSRALDVHRPLHRLHLGDAAGTVVYVSGITGEVVRDATLQERVWNYAGAWIHWLYPLRGNVFNPHWTDIVNWLSIAGIVLTVTGTVVGVMRWRFAGRYKTGARTPYRGFMMRWHHVFGLVFALVTFTWIFSGLMSMNPWKIFDSGAAPLRTEAMHGGPLVLPVPAASVPALLAAASPNTRELRWTQTAGHALVQAHSPTGAPLVLHAGTGDPHAWQPGALAHAAAQLLPYPVVRTDTLQAYDLHYYDRAAHTMTGGGDKPLPVLRVVFDDPQATWVHIDPHTGAVLGRTDTRRRTSRWLFAMLHSWDWLPLLERRPLWDVVLIVLSLGGAVMSVTGVVIGWRRLGLKLRGG